MKTVFILVEPAVAGNIGAAARAIKVMGFDELWLINPKGHQDDEARWLAHASGDILDNARLFSTLADAAKETDLLIATTAKERTSHQDYLHAENLPAFLADKQETLATTGVVFGREESGLTSDEMRLCDTASSLPMATTYPSLNLSQAVMLYAYILSKPAPVIENPDNSNNSQGFRVMKSNIIDMLYEAGYSEAHPILQRIRERLSFLSGKDMNLLHSAAVKLRRKYMNNKH